jgi:hypothetical protein
MCFGLKDDLYVGAKPDIVIESCRRHYNAVRRYRPPAFEVFVPRPPHVRLRYVNQLRRWRNSHR